MTNLWIGEYQNWNTLYTPYISYSLRITKIFLLHAVWYGNRAFQLLKFSMSQEVKKRLFLALSIESSKNFYCNVFPETNVVLFTCFQRLFIGQSLRENFVPMRNTLDRSYRDRNYWKRSSQAEILFERFGLEDVAHAKNHREEH